MISKKHNQYSSKQSPLPPPPPPPRKKKKWLKIPSAALMQDADLNERLMQDADLKERIDAIFGNSDDDDDDDIRVAITEATTSRTVSSKPKSTLSIILNGKENNKNNPVQIKNPQVSHVSASSLKSEHQINNIVYSSSGSIDIVKVLCNSKVITILLSYIKGSEIRVGLVSKDLLFCFFFN